MVNFLQSLSVHISDNHEAYGKGFVLCAIRYLPSILQEVVVTEKHETEVAKAFESLGYDKGTSALIAVNHRKFLFPQMISFLQQVSPRERPDVVKLVSKLNVASDIGDLMPKLVEHFACRRLILDTLLRIDNIGISVQRLLGVLDNLRPATSEVIRSCLGLPPC